MFLIGQTIVLMFTLGEVFSTPINLSDNEDVSSYFLPDNVNPLNYKIYFDHSNFNDHRNKYFAGKVSIDLEVLTPTRDIRLHKKNIKIVSCGLKKTNFSEIYEIQSRSYDEKTDQFDLKFKEILNPGFYTLDIDFTGQYGTQFGLIRRSDFRFEIRMNWSIMASHMEPTYAREVFPCFDEPRFKSTFELYLLHHKNFSALSNMPVKKTEKIDQNYLQTSFQKSPPMPTYTFAIVLHEFPSFTIGNRNLTVYANPNYINDVRPKFANADKILEALEKYFGINYVLPKMDHVFVPGWDAQGFLRAMENWGLTIFIELFNPDELVNLIIHEYTHQWFGNLVTPKWWNDTWLNEGFARLFSDYELKEFEFSDPNLITRDFSRNIDMLMFAEDSPYETPGAIIANRNSTDAVIDSFDKDVLNKAAYILRMIQHAVTKEVFQKWMQNFLNKNKFGSVSSHDLYESFEGPIINGDRTLNIKDVMESWLHQTSYPIITITRDYEKNTVKISQEPRKTCKSGTKQEDCRWYVPLSYSDGSSQRFNDTRASIWLTPEKSMSEFKVDTNADDMLLFNLRTGFYRINYDSRNWALILHYMRSPDRRFKNIHPLDRIRLTADAMFFINSGTLDWKIVLSLMDYLSMEDDIFVWQSEAVTSVVHHFNAMFSATKYHQLYQNHVVLCTSKTLREHLSSQYNVEIPLAEDDWYFKPPSDISSVYKEEIWTLKLFLSSFKYSKDTKEPNRDNIPERDLRLAELVLNNEKFVDSWLNSCPVAEIHPNYNRYYFV